MMMPINEAQFFLDHIKKTDNVLEYGSGESTLEIAKLCNSILSIEHNPEWYEKVKSTLPDNAILILKEPNHPYVDGYECGTYYQFENYIKEPWTHCKKNIPDIILVDGRARDHCVKFVVENICKFDTVIFIHDFNSRREQYKDVFNYLEEVERVGDMSKFKIKK